VSVASTVIVLCGIIALGAMLYGWLEAGWLRTRVLDVPVAGLPAALDGVRIAHLSDFHLGARLSRGNGASERAVAWVAARRPDLVCVTGDLVSHPRGEPLLRSLLAQLERPFVILGNHDVAVTRDPFSRAAELRDLEQTVLLRDRAEVGELRGERLCVVGVDPETYEDRTTRPWELVDRETAFRLLLCHYPKVVEALPPHAFQLVLAGHLHAGQICLPLSPSRRLTLAHPRARFVAGVYELPSAVMHVSPGTGTTFVPFRFFARPEVTELVLRRRG
jgi:predicted MPP superfamily phosphohydrolase